MIYSPTEQIVKLWHWNVLCKRLKKKDPNTLFLSLLYFLATSISCIFPLPQICKGVLIRQGLIMEVPDLSLQIQK